MEATKQLILRLPPEIHKELKMLSVSREKTMTEMVVEWVKREMKALKGSGKKPSDKILEILSSPVDESVPSRYTDEELDQMVEDDKLASEEHAEIDTALKKRKAKK